MSLPEFFFDRVSAEIRRQMDDVLALAEQLGRQGLASESRDCVAGISASAEGVRRMMERAHDLRSVAVQGLGFSPQTVRLRELVDEIQERWQGRAAADGVTLIASYDGDPEARVTGDRTRLVQVFDGFVGEAVAGDPRGAVEFSLRAHANDAKVRIEGRVRGGDSGWAAQALEARVRDVDARLGLEVAMGVMLARRIVEQLGGAVTADATGTSFEIVLPTAADAPVAAPAPTRAQEERAAHVLIVDDNATNRVVAQALCEMLRCTSEVAGDGVEAVEAAQSGRFDLILMDIRMPRLDGVAATQEIRKLPGKAGSAPILALTANVDREDAERYVAAGMNGVLEKPMKADDLRAALQRTLGRPTDVAA